MSLRLAVLASHSGSTLQAIMDACEQGALDARITLIISNNSGSGALQRGKSWGISTAHLSDATHPSGLTLDTAICKALEAANAYVIVLAGNIKKLGPLTLSRFKGHVLKTHPALLPKYGGHGMHGSNVHAAELAAKEPSTGISIHLVDGYYDTGPIVAQCEVPIADADTVETLTQRLQAQERRFLVDTLQSIASGELKLPG